MRRSIAAHMVESLRTAAHCTSIAEADMSRIEAARRALGLTYLPFVARCAIDALRAHPDLNATLEGETLTRHASVHLGIAVSLGEEGLIVPVIHDAQELSHEGLATRIAELARRARAGELNADEVRGGTFTITNPGGYGTLASTPIINQPQVAILDLEAVVKRAVVLTDEQGRDSLAIRPMTNLCLSWDHRALDGALAARFLGAVRARIENWGTSDGSHSADRVTRDADRRRTPPSTSCCSCAGAGGRARRRSWRFTPPCSARRSAGAGFGATRTCSRRSTTHSGCQPR